MKDEYPQNPGHEPGDDAVSDAKFRVLVLGVGNDMMGDEGVGVRAVRELSSRYNFPPDVRIMDGGVGGLSLLPTIRDADEVLIIDAVDARARPGSIFMFNSDEIEIADITERLSMHDTGIVDVIRTAALMEESIDATIIGVQPKKMDEFGGGLSRPVEKNLGRVVEIVCDLLASRGYPPREKGSRSFAQQGEREDDA